MKTAITLIGRFQPPTKGHEVVVRQAVDLAHNYKASLIIFTTRTNDSKKNPLPIKTKMSYLKMIFKGVKIVDVVNAFEALKILSDRGFKKVLLIAGSDREEGYKKLLASGKASGNFAFEESEIIGLLRDPDAEDASGASATKARSATINNDLSGFMAMIPDALTPPQKKRLFKIIRQGLKLEV